MKGKIKKVEITRLRKLLQLWGVNQKQFARLLGVEPPLVTYYFQGKKRPGRDVLERLVRYGVSMEWYFLGEGEIITDIERYNKLLVKIKMT